MIRAAFRSVLVAVFAATVVVPALAQPRPLFRGETTSTPPAATPQAESTTAAPATPTPTPLVPQPTPPGAGSAAPETKPAGVEVGALAVVDPSAIGLLKDAEGGLGIDLWAGSDARVVQRLVELLPMEGAAKPVRDLARRLLLTTASPPQGPALPGHSLIGARAERLAAGGFAREAHELLRIARPGPQDRGAADAENDALLLAEDYQAACGQVRDRVRIDDRPTWLMRVGFCQALVGESAAAALSASLLREQHVEDPLYFRLLSAVGGDASIKIENLPAPKPLHLAMMKVAKRNLPNDSVTGAGAAVLRTIARASNAGLELRVRAAEQALNLGVIDAEAVIQLYGAAQPKPDQVEAVAATGKIPPGPLGGAVLYHAILSKTDPATRARLLQAAWRRGAEQGAYLAAARVNLRAIKDMAPASELAFVAGDAARALIAAGETTAALPWVDLARRSGAIAKEAASLLPLVQLVDDKSGSWGAATLRAWKDSLKELKPAEQNARLATAFALFDVLGHPVEAGIWPTLLEQPAFATASVPSAAVWHALDNAVAIGRKGEAIAAALIVIGAPEGKAAHPIALASGLAALVKLGLDKEARSIAVEAALAAGL